MFEEILPQVILDQVETESGQKLTPSLRAALKIFFVNNIPKFFSGEVASLWLSYPCLWIDGSTTLPYPWEHAQRGVDSWAGVMTPELPEVVQKFLAQPGLLALRKALTDFREEAGGDSAALGAAYARYGLVESVAKGLMLMSCYVSHTFVYRKFK